MLNEEFLFLYDYYQSVNPSYPYWEFDRFCFDDCDSSECESSFRVAKDDIPILSFPCCPSRILSSYNKEGTSANKLFRVHRRHCSSKLSPRRKTTFSLRWTQAHPWSKIPICCTAKWANRKSYGPVRGRHGIMLRCWKTLARWTLSNQ